MSYFGKFDLSAPVGTSARIKVTVLPRKPANKLSLSAQTTVASLSRRPITARDDSLLSSVASARNVASLHNYTTDAYELFAFGW